MLKKCFENDCSREITSSCSCKNPSIYICDEHISKHIRAPGNHLIESLIIEIDDNQRNKLILKIKDIIKNIHELKIEIIANSKKITDCIEKETKQTLKNLANLEKNAANLLFHNRIIKEIFENAWDIDITIDKSVSRVNSIKTMIEELFALDYGLLSWKESDQIIFPKDDNIGGLVSIDLESLIQSDLNYSPKIGAYCHTCKITKYEYFFHGGKLQNNTSFRGEAYIINIKEKTFAKLQDGPAKSAGGSILKDNKVYLFGGWNGNEMNTCDYFNLQTREWKSIHALPQPSGGITASILNKEIILAGYKHECLYSYNESVYTNALVLPKGKMKLVYEGWIFVHSTLYENKEENNTKWIVHNINLPWSDKLYVYSIFKQKDYLYFIDTKKSLMRINTRLKILEKTEYFINKI